MFVDSAQIFLEQFRHPLLSESDGLLLQTHFQLRLTVLGLIEDKFGGFGLILRFIIHYTDAFLAANSVFERGCVRQFEHVE